MSDYAPVCICSDGNERGRAMNDKTVGGEAHSVIRWHTAHFTKQMLNIWDEYNKIRYTTCYNCHSHLAWAPFVDRAICTTSHSRETASLSLRDITMHLCSSGSCTSLWCYHGDEAVLLFASLPILGSQHLSAAAVNFKKYPPWSDLVIIQKQLIHSFFKQVYWEIFFN